ncbi:MAG: FAD-dependent oxidoreductase [Trueperaceae bacterium]
MGLCGRWAARFAPDGRLTLDGEPVETRRIVLATGAEAALPPIAGLREAQTWTYVEALEAEALPEHLLVIGAGPAARARRSRIAKRIGVFVLIVLVLVIMLFPFYWMILTSLRNQVANTSPVPIWFFEPTLENYRNVVAENNFLKFTWNSFVIAALSTGIGLVLGLPAAYSIARYKQNGLALAILVARLTPYITYLVPRYIAFRALGLIDTYLALTMTHFIVVSALGVGLFGLVTLAERLLMPWNRVAED